MDDPGDIRGISPTQAREIDAYRVAWIEWAKARIAALEAQVESARDRESTIRGHRRAT